MDFNQVILSGKITSVKVDVDRETVDLFLAHGRFYRDIYVQICGGWCLPDHIQDLKVGMEVIVSGKVFSRPGDERDNGCEIHVDSGDVKIVACESE